MLADQERIAIDGALARVTFGRFDLDLYPLFLKCKQLPESQIEYDWKTDRYTITTPARFAPMLGVQNVKVEGAGLPLAKHLFDYQAFAVEQALAAKRYALWLDTGLGKTAVYLEWVRQVLAKTRGRVLILAPLTIIRQIQDEAARFYRKAVRPEHLTTREAVIDWCQRPGMGSAITNYEKLIPGEISEFRYLAGLVADESSCLKTGGGTIKWNLIHSAKGVEYKLSCTATPAPNDSMEFASQASFLEKLRSGNDVLWTYFKKNQKTGEWKVLANAREAFYRFLSSWSLYLRNPKNLGFGDILASLPDPDIREYDVPITDIQRELMYGFLTKSGKGLWSDDRLGVQERSKLGQLAKGFLYLPGGSGKYSLVESHKPAKVAELVKADAGEGLQVLVWTVFDAESEIIAEHLRGEAFTVATLDGDMGEDDRLATIAAFKSGRLQVLISKAQLLGYGLNFQNCRSMVFSGFDDSFERFYQAIRRAYRFGQTEVVRVHIPYVRELEGMIFENVRQKQRRFDEETALQEGYYREALGLQETRE